MKRYNLSLFILLLIALHMSCSRKPQAEANLSFIVDSIYERTKDSLFYNPQWVIDVLTPVTDTIQDSLSFFQLGTCLSGAYILLDNFTMAKHLLHNSIDFATKHSSESKLCREILSNNYNSLGILHSIRREYDTALFYLEKCLAQLDPISEKSYKVNVYLNMSDLLNSQGKYAQSIGYLREALSIVDSSMTDSQLRSSISLELSHSYSRIGNHEMAKRYLDEVDNSSVRDKYLYLNRKGLYHFLKGDYIESLDAYKHCLEYTHEGNHFDNYLTEVNLGSLFVKLQQPDSAQYYLDRVISYATKENLTSMLFYAATYKAELALQQQSPALAQYWLQKYGLQEGLGADVISEHNKSLLKYHLQMGDYRNAYQQLLHNIQYDDSIKSERVLNQIAELDMRYKQDSTLLRRDIQIQTQETRINFLQQIKLLWVLISCIGFALILLIWHYLRRNKKTNRILASKNQEIEEKNTELKWQNAEILQQKEEIETQRDEIEAQRDIAIQQKEKIEEMHREILSSIEYAQLIQRAVLPSGSTVMQHFPRSFMIFRPRDVVSGDFYWMANHNGRRLIAIADCTGHGVPGAFMSMLAISFLNEFHAHRQSATPADTLEEMRKYIITSLQQEGVVGEQKDGLDIAFVSLEPNKGQLHYAGANSHLHIFRKGSDKLQKIKADSMPVAIHPEMAPYTNHTLTIEKGDRIYLFSDGITDQFGGPNGKKFKSNQLESVLTTSAQVDIIEQGYQVEQALNQWMRGNGTPYEQTDDILVFGLEL